jgi:hypothetical protein
MSGNRGNKRRKPADEDEAILVNPAAPATPAPTPSASGVSFALLNSDHHSFSGDPGEDVLDFILKMEAFFEMARVPPSHRAHAVAFAIRGNARRWFVNQSDETRTSWRLLKNALQSEFGRAHTDMQSRMENVHACRQKTDEKVTDFTKRFMTAAYEAKLEGETILSMFMLGLREDLRREVKRQRPKTFNEAKELAEEFESDGPVMVAMVKGMQGMFTCQHAAATPPQPQAMQPPPMQLQAMQPTTPSRNAAPSRPRNRPYCTLCRRSGHTLKNASRPRPAASAVSKDTPACDAARPNVRLLNLTAPNRDVATAVPLDTFARSVPIGSRETNLAHCCVHRRSRQSQWAQCIR